MIRALLLVLSLTVTLSVNAADIYGLDPQMTNSVMKKYGKEIDNFESTLQKAIKNIPINGKGNQLSSKTEEILTKKRTMLIDQLTKEYGFLFVDFQIVFYPDDNHYYMTIEIVDKQHPERLRFLNTAKEEHVEKRGLINPI